MRLMSKRLSDETKSEILKMHEEGYTNPQIMEKLSVGRTSVSDYINGKFKKYDPEWIEWFTNEWESMRKRFQKIKRG